MASKSYTVLGLMSGSSLDGLDIAACTFDVDKTEANPILNWKLIEAATIPFSEKWQARLAHLPTQSALNFAKTNTYFGYYMGELVNDFLANHDIKPDLIASHGHTIFHDPNTRFTSQIGDGAALAMTTNLTVCCDFRTTDIAINGEGTPLAPIADQLLFEGYDFYLNLGGIANISCPVASETVAFDIGACNQVLNALAQLANLEYDKDGHLASKGKIHTGLFYQLNQLDFFEDDYPKSLDNSWVKEFITKPYLETEASIEDRLRTACEQLAFQVNKSTVDIMKTERLNKERYTMFLSGGGVFNRFLVSCLRDYCPKIDFVIPNEPIVHFKEAILMALMGVLRIEGIPNCLASVTGATMDTIGGALYQPFGKSFVIQ